MSIAQPLDQLPPLDTDVIREQRRNDASLPWPLPRGSLAAQLFEHPYEFDFFQAVWLLERLEPERAAVGRQGSPTGETVVMTTRRPRSRA